MATQNINYGNKFEKKFSRSKAKLTKDGFTFSDLVTNYMVISNAGVGNGVRREELEDLITGYASLHMPARKSYATVHFADQRTAEEVCAKLQGYVHKSSHNLATAAATFYVHFVNSFNIEEANHIVTNDYRDVPGLEVLEDFISKNEEIELLDFLKNENPITSEGNTENSLKNRQVWHYGYEFRYKYNDVDPENPKPNGLPENLLLLITRMKQYSLFVNEPNQVTINKYEPGHGIPPHIDNPDAFDENLFSISLCSATVMDFRKGKQHVRVVLQPRSLISFKDEARFQWTHGICPRKVDLIPSGSDGNITPINRGVRYSLTFRRVKDEYKGPKTGTVVDLIAHQPVCEREAASLEELHVHQVYNEIASHFTVTREKPWPKVVNFISSLQTHSLVLDVGCGSGRYLGVRRDIHMIGCDKSENLIAICHDKGHQVFSCDGLELPVKSCIVDACICIAVVHHYSTVERRIRAIQQLLRVTKPGGRILISVWALEQEYKRVKSKYLKPIPNGSGGDLKYPVPKESTSGPQQQSPCDQEARRLSVHINRTPFQQQDVLVPWHKKTSSTKIDECSKTTHARDDNMEKLETFHRFYHVFKKGELDDLCTKIGGAEILDSYYDEGNWCVIIKKLQDSS